MKSNRGYQGLADTNTNKLPISLLGTTPISGSGPLSPVFAHVEKKQDVDHDRLILEHLPMVRFIARRLAERLPQHVEFEELVSAGVVGLIDAVNKFDYRKDVQFKSYAQFRVRGAILDSLRTLDWSPRDLRRKKRAIEEVSRTLTAQLGRAPFEQEIASEIGVTLETYQQLLNDLKSLEIGSLNVERGEETGEEEVAYVAAPEKENPLLQCLEGEMRDQLTAVIETLPERERLVLTLYYYEELTMKEIGLTLGVVESRVSQIHASAVRRLRKTLGVPQKNGSKS
ncbi:MAG: sigma-70 family RNA polymerase sigma factor [Janthinobacterium lividum]